MPLLYTPIHPTSRDDALTQISGLFSMIVQYFLTLWCAATAMGKTNMMRACATYWHTTHPKGVVFLIAPNKTIADQLIMDFTADNTIIRVTDHKTSKSLVTATFTALARGQRPVICCDHLSHHNGNFSRATRCMIALMRALYEKEFKLLVLIDEFHLALTSLTGGIMMGIWHHVAKLEKYKNILAHQQWISLNLFDIFREVDAHVVGCSATNNNVIFSKLPAIGATPSDIHVINAYPIQSLYAEIDIRPMDTTNMAEIGPGLEAAEARGAKSLIICRDHADIAKFKADYLVHYGRPLTSYVEITSETELPTPDQLKEAQYVIGIMLPVNGFNLFSHTGEHFSHIVIRRKFSDKISQPLSSNPDHELYMEISAMIAQAIGRVGRGGTLATADVPEFFALSSLYELHLKISDLIAQGCNEFERTCHQPEVSQEGRTNQLIMVSLIQNFRDGNDIPTVEKLCNALTALTDRDIRTESESELWSPLFWTRAIGILMKVKVGEITISEARELVKNVSARTGLEHRGGGGQERMIDPRITAEVKERSGGICCHCSHPVIQGNICHYMAEARDGPYQLDNLGYGCPDCDAAYEAANIVIDPSNVSQVYIHRKLNYRPDLKQVRCISPVYLADRWKQQCAIKSCLPDDFHAWLNDPINGMLLVSLQ